MSGKRYTEEFKIEAAKQVADRGHPIADVAKRLGVSYKSLQDWVKKYSKQKPQRQADDIQTEEIR